MEKQMKRFERPLVVLEGQTPQEIALDLWFGMDEKEKAAFRRYMRKLPKIKGLDVIGLLELLVALSASGAL